MYLFSPEVYIRIVYSLKFYWIDPCLCVGELPEAGGENNPKITEGKISRAHTESRIVCAPTSQRGKPHNSQGIG